MRRVVSRVASFVLQGIDAVPCEIEVDLSPVGLPRTTVVGLPDAAVKESVERVRTAILNSGYRFPQHRITINLAPADVRKEGPVYDLPFAIGLLEVGGTITHRAGAAERSAERQGELAATGGGSIRSSAAGADRQRPTASLPAPPRLRDYCIAGELALDGRVRPIRGAISLAMMAKQRGARGVIVPRANAPEAATVAGLDVLGVDTLPQVVGLLNGTGHVEPHPPLDVERMLAAVEVPIDFGDVRGQEAAKRALTVACAGAHNVLMIGPAGTGKSMMAKALPGVLPPLSREEALEVTRIYSSVGQIPQGEPLMLRRPVRAPHHTASSPAVIGGGSIPKPGEVTLAHHGVLFLDELPEFDRDVLETLRQPLEDGAVTVARAHAAIRFPARFMLVTALNPTAKGNHVAGDQMSQRAMDHYLSRLSDPLVDRIDIHVEVPAVRYRELTGPARGTTTEQIRVRVADARSRQRARQGRTLNAALGRRDLDTVARLDDASARLMEQAMTELGLSARAYDKVRRVARTIADLEGKADVGSHHIAEAIQYRLLDRQR